MRHYVVNLYNRDQMLLYGMGAPAKNRKDAIEQAKRAYLSAYPDMKWQLHTATVDRGDAGNRKSYDIRPVYRHPINARVEGRSLVITADNDGRAELKEAQSKGYYRMQAVVADAIEPSWRFIAPENIGALTDAPIIIDEAGYTIEDDGEYHIEDDAEVFWFPNYMIEDPWERLMRTGRVEFRDGND